MRDEAHTRQHVSIPGHNLLSTKPGRFPGLVYHHAVGVHDSIGRHCWMGGRVLEGELACELAVDGAREVNSGFYLVGGAEAIADDHTDLSPAFETRSSISSAH